MKIVAKSIIKAEQKEIFREWGTHKKKINPKFRV